MKHKNIYPILNKESIKKSFPPLSVLKEEDIERARLEILKYYDLLKEQSLSPEILLLHSLLKGRYFLTVKEASLFLGVSTKTILREIARGNLKSIIWETNIVSL